MKKRTAVIALAVLAVLAGGYYAFTAGTGGASKTTPTPTQGWAELENIVTASGTLLPAKRANLSFKTSGLVAQIAVKVGDMVKEGDVLIRLETAELEAAAAQARAAVTAAQAALARLKAGPSKEEIAVAQANLEAAQAQMAKVRAGARPEEIAMAKAALEKAEAVLRDAQAAYDQVRGDPMIGMLPQSQALHLATLEYRIAQARYEQVVKGATPEDLRIAEAAVAVAQANLDRVKAGARAEDIAAAEAQVAQAQAAYQQAQAALAAATITAPFPGMVAAVHVNPGEAVSPGMPVLSLGDTTKMQVETDDLSETNIAKVKVGQTAAVTFEALPGKTFKGKVISIAPMATQRQGGTNYTVTIEMEGLDPILRWGMTAHVEIDVHH